MASCSPIERQRRGERRLALLAHGDPPPVSVVRAGGRADVLLLGDHAGNAIPLSLGNLGLGDGDRRRHIAWDVGVRALGEEMAALLDATFVHQPFSRLVIDCNRHPGSDDAILPFSDGTPVRGNQGVDELAHDERRIAIHAPYHERIATEIGLRHRPGRYGPMLAAPSGLKVCSPAPECWPSGPDGCDGAFQSSGCGWHRSPGAVRAAFGAPRLRRYCESATFGS